MESEYKTIDQITRPNSMLGILTGLIFQQLGWVDLQVIATVVASSSTPSPHIVVKYYFNMEYYKFLNNTPNTAFFYNTPHYTTLLIKLHRISYYLIIILHRLQLLKYYPTEYYFIKSTPPLNIIYSNTPPQKTTSL